MKLTSNLLLYGRHPRLVGWKWTVVNQLELQCTLRVIWKPLQLELVSMGMLSGYHDTPLSLRIELEK